MPAQKEIPLFTRMNFLEKAQEKHHVLRLFQKEL